MLSAVAARRAAKATAEVSLASSSKPPSPPPASRSPSSSPKPTTPSKSGNKPPSKRKPRSSGHAGPSKNKKVKVTHAPGKTDRNTRYFDSSDASKTRNKSTVDDPIVWMGANSESDSSSGQEMDMETPPVGLSSIPVTKPKRTWSPSRPMVDSSDDEDPGPLGMSDPTTYRMQPTPRKPEPEPLSTFRPVLNDNVYSVSESEGAISGKTVILVLPPNETVALVGTYSLRVLQGGLTLLGVTLSPSDTKHTVFAPRSSPIPILSWAASDRQGSCSFPIPPTIRRQANTSIILIEYAHTGVEGLGQICKTSENIFKPPRGSDAIPGTDLAKIHTVCVSQSLYAHSNQSISRKVTHSTKDVHPFILPSSWEAALASIEEQPVSGISTPPICLVKGPKKSGKSTLARTLVNRLLSRSVLARRCICRVAHFPPLVKISSSRFP